MATSGTVCEIATTGSTIAPSNRECVMTTPNGNATTIANTAPNNAASSVGARYRHATPDDACAAIRPTTSTGLGR